MQNIGLTSYVDDLAVSGRIADTAGVANQMILALSRAKLKTNKAKVVIMKSSQQQVVCGLIVSKRLSLTSKLKRTLLSDIANKRMSEASAEGWVSNLHNVDPDFGKKFSAYALQKGVIRPKVP